jgi:acetyl esterase/lipase
LAAIRADESTKVQALVGLAPALEMVEDAKRRGQVSVAVRNLLDLSETLDDAALVRIATISPAEGVKPGLPPVLLVQGTADKSVRHVDTAAFSERLKQVKVPCELIEIKGAPHRMMEWDKFAPEYPAKVVVWLKTKLERGPR